MESIDEILKGNVVVDAHFDLMCDVLRQRQQGRKKVIETDYLQSFISGGVNIVVSSLYIEDEYLPDMALRKALDQVSCLYAEVDESPEKIMLCKDIDDINEAIEGGKLGIMLSFEGVEPLYNDISLLRVFYELGVRIVGLVWSRRNYAADGCHYGDVREGTKGGLTDFGVQLIEAAEDLGMLVDVSHLNDEGFWDVMKYAKNPVIASHSNARNLAQTMRNLCDEQIKALADTGGVIGLNASNMLVADNDQDATIEYFVNHLDHIVNLVGVEHVGFGFDFCDHLFKYISVNQIKGLSRKPFDIFGGHSEIGTLVHELVRRGYKHSDLEHIIGGNFLKVYSQVLK